jgi:hypothetical protein
MADPVRIADAELRQIASTIEAESHAKDDAWRIL